MDFHSVNTSSAAWPASRWPLPVSFVPPNGRCTSAPVVPALMYVIPATRSRVAREDRGREPVADAVRDPDRLVEVAHLDQRRRRPEDLLLRDPHLRIDVAE